MYCARKQHCSLFDAESDFRRSAELMLEEQLLFGCEERGLPRAEALRLACEVADRMWAEEQAMRCAPESRIEQKLREAREALQRTGELLEALRRDAAELRRALGAVCSEQ